MKGIYNKQDIQYIMHYNKYTKVYCCFRIALYWSMAIWSACAAGFYGRPWTMSQRKELFRRWMNRSYHIPSALISSYISLLLCYLHREQRWGLNTYLYAPKDDYKHRMYWRDLYSLEEAGDRLNDYMHLTWTIIQNDLQLYIYMYL